MFAHPMAVVNCDQCFWSLADYEDEAERYDEIYSDLMKLDTERCQAVLKLLLGAAITAHLNDLNDALVYLDQAAVSYFGSGGAHGCFDALRSLDKAICACEHGAVMSLDYLFLKHEIRVLCRTIRDSLIVRIQSRVVVGDKEAFEDALSAAYGERMDKKSQLYSLLMNSYKKQIWDRYPNEAFDSLTERANKARQKTRTRRSRV